MTEAGVQGSRVRGAACQWNVCDPDPGTPAPPCSPAARRIEGLEHSDLRSQIPTMGRRDGRVTLDEVITHVAASTARPIFPFWSTSRTGTAPSPMTLHTRSSAPRRSEPSADRSRTTTPPAGSTTCNTRPARVAAAADAARSLAFPFTLTARAENPSVAIEICRIRSPHCRRMQMPEQTSCMRPGCERRTRFGRSVRLLPGRSTSLRYPASLRRRWPTPASDG